MTPVQVIRVDPAKLISVRRMIIFLGFPLVQAMDLAFQFDEYLDRSEYCHFGDRRLCFCLHLTLSGVFLPSCVCWFDLVPDLTALVADFVSACELVLLCDYE